MNISPEFILQLVATSGVGIIGFFLKQVLKKLDALQLQQNEMALTVAKLEVRVSHLESGRGREQ